VAVILVVIATTIIYLNTTVPGRLMKSVLRLAIDTLGEEDYLLYDLDIKELCCDYADSDVYFDGMLSLDGVGKLKVSSLMEMQGERSFAQKQMKLETSVNVLWLQVGQLMVYEQDQTIYAAAPMIGDLQYAFPTGMNLFPQLPEFTSDIRTSWFLKNSVHFFKLFQNTAITPFTDEYTVDGVDGFHVIIPSEEGAFLWKLLGMEAPEDDTQVDLYLRGSRIVRIDYCTDNMLPGSSLVMDGEHLDHLAFSYDLPERERLEVELTRNPDHIHWIDLEGTYYANNGKDVQFSAAFLWGKTTEQDGYNIEVREIKMEQEETVTFSAQFTGTICHLENAPSVIDETETKSFEEYEVLDWRAIRDDADEFVQKITDKINGK